VLEALGLETDIKALSVPLTYTSLAQTDVDVFPSNWMPTMPPTTTTSRPAHTLESLLATL